METIQYPTDTKANKNHCCDFCLEQIIKGEVYEKSTHKYEGIVYSWKSHKKCSELTGLLNMDGDEGITSDIFIEDVRDAYQRLMSKLNPEIYQSKNFKYPPFKEQLEFVYNNSKQ